MFYYSLLNAIIIDVSAVITGCCITAQQMANYSIVDGNITARRLGKIWLGVSVIGILIYFGVSKTNQDGWVAGRLWGDIEGEVYISSSEAEVGTELENKLYV